MAQFRHTGPGPRLRVLHLETVRGCTAVHIGTALFSEGVWLTLSSEAINGIARIRHTGRGPRLRVLHLETVRGRPTVHIGTALISEGVWLTLSSETIGAIDTGSANPSAVPDSAT